MEQSSQFVVYQDGKSQWRWKLHGAHGGLLATSGSTGYTSRQQCLQGVTRMKRLVGEAEVVDAHL